MEALVGDDSDCHISTLLVISYKRSQALSLLAATSVPLRLISSSPELSDFPPSRHAGHRGYNFYEISPMNDSVSPSPDGVDSSMLIGKHLGEDGLAHG
jgi:hypothetical protein